VGAAQTTGPADGPSIERRDGTAPRSFSLVAASADVAAVLLFVVLGRRAHDEGSQLSGTASVAWPFICGALLGWIVLLLARRPTPSSVRGGLVVVTTTVVFGMMLRAATGGGVQVAFVVVATVVLAAFLLGWRLLLSVARRALSPRI
jgi:hypothetical protein